MLFDPKFGLSWKFKLETESIRCFFFEIANSSGWKGDNIDKKLERDVSICTVPAISMCLATMYSAVRTPKPEMSERWNERDPLYTALNNAYNDNRKKNCTINSIRQYHGKSYFTCLRLKMCPYVCSLLVDSCFIRPRSVHISLFCSRIRQFNQVWSKSSVRVHTHTLEPSHAHTA